MGMQEEEARQFSAEEMLAYHIHVLNSGMLETDTKCLPVYSWWGEGATSSDNRLTLHFRVWTDRT